METISYSKLTTAVKEHKCNFCCQPIERGTKYFKSTHSMDGEIYDWKTHQSCSEIADKLKMYDYVDEGVTTDYFIETIKDEYSNLMSKTQNELYESKGFVIPKFTEQLQFVINFHCAAGENYLLKPT